MMVRPAYTHGPGLFLEADMAKTKKEASNQDPHDQAIRHLARAVGEVIESQLHAGGARNARLGSAELHLTAALELIEPDHEPDLDGDGDGNGNDKKPPADAID